jgi:uncharacterized protein YchJ
VFLVFSSRFGRADRILEESTQIMGFIDMLNRVFPPKENDPTKDVGRNDPCHCGSGKKYKSCHMVSDQRKKNGGRR